MKHIFAYLELFTFHAMLSGSKHFDFHMILQGPKAISLQYEVKDEKHPLREHLASTAAHFRDLPDIIKTLQTRNFLLTDSTILLEKTLEDLERSTWCRWGETAPDERLRALQKSGLQSDSRGRTHPKRHQLDRCS